MIILIALLVSAIAIIVIQLYEIKKLKEDIYSLERRLTEKELMNKYYGEIAERINILKNNSPVIIERVETK